MSRRPVRRSIFRPSAVFIGLLAIFLTGALLSWFEFGNPSVNIIVFVVAGWLVSLSLHEYAHALYAYLRGDHSVVAKGYLSLNLLKYTHPVLSIVFPVLFLLIGGIGLPGGAVWLDRHAIRGGRRAQSLVSLVGPLTNVVFALMLAIPFASLTVGGYLGHQVFWDGLAFLTFLQLTAAAINLLPVPGLDGGNALRPWLRASAATVFDYVQPYGFLILVVVLFQPVANGIFFNIIWDVSDALGVPPLLSARGQLLFQFWR